jgi:hemolysin III
MLLALPVTWLLWKRCLSTYKYCKFTSPARRARHQRIKALCLIVFGITLTICYGSSAVFHGARVSGEPLITLQRLDHVGIYLLIAGTYTPIAWGLMRGPWLWGTLTAAWTAAILCGTRVLCGDLMPMWLSTLTYLVMGWGALFCYNELARSYSHRKLLFLPLGGLFYSVGAIMNLMHWPAIAPGVFAAHEMFHFFVIAGSTCHVLFMLGVVIPSPDPAALRVQSDIRLPSDRPGIALFPRQIAVGEPHWPWRVWFPDFRTMRTRSVPATALPSLSHDNAVEVAYNAVEVA